ncbi:ATG8-interacting protein 2 [Malania oleifera]|uniref:ATG8-interacting protein 2 n=1 Tax=Malania oleifera TaxID=397392 RepID=UPI0025AE8BBA|nr:ATG8-interacting protein 2 [Malania oleifera]
MADRENREKGEEGEETNTCGNEWEVVSLTASAYAAAPGPEGVEQNNDNDGNERNNATGKEEAETGHAMFMSSHFVFPPSQHENLPLEPDTSGVHKELGDENVVPELNVEAKGRVDSKAEEDWDVKALTVPDEFPEIQLFDGKGNKLSVHGTEFEEGTALQELNSVDKEHIIYSAAKFSSFPSETTIGGPTAYDEKTIIPDLTDPSEQGLDLTGIPQSPEPMEDDKYGGSNDSNLPCEAWWKRRAVSLYAHAKEANTFWSIFIATAVMGLVILGQRWQKERWQVLQLKWQCSLGDAKTSRLLGPISRFKDVIVGGNRRGSSIATSGSTER